MQALPGQTKERAASHRERGRNFRVLRQSHISEKNVARLEQMVKSENPHVASLAVIVLRVAWVNPYKTRRLKFLAQRHPELLQELEDTGLVLCHSWYYWETAELHGQANWEATEISLGEDSETTDPPVQDDWTIPF
jgi:hypothetical protein